MANAEQNPAATGSTGRTPLASSRSCSLAYDRQTYAKSRGTNLNDDQWTERTPHPWRGHAYGSSDGEPPTSTCLLGIPNLVMPVMQSASENDNLCWSVLIIHKITSKYCTCNAHTHISLHVSLRSRTWRAVSGSSIFIYMADAYCSCKIKIQASCNPLRTQPPWFNSRWHWHQGRNKEGVARTAFGTILKCQGKNEFVSYQFCPYPHQYSDMSIFLIYTYQWFLMISHWCT